MMVILTPNVCPLMVYATLNGANDIEYLVDGKLLVARRVPCVQIKEDDKIQCENIVILDVI